MDSLASPFLKSKDLLFAGVADTSWWVLSTSAGREAGLSTAQIVRERTISLRSR
jgi:hypothetical protein